MLNLAETFTCCSCGRQEEELLRRKTEQAQRRGMQTPPRTPSGHSTPSTAPSASGAERAPSASSSHRDSQPCGVGISFTVDEAGLMRVESLVHGGPAYTSGMVRRDDVLVEVDGRDVTEMPVEAVGALITGPQGSYVSLGFQRTDWVAGQQASSHVVVVEMVRVHIRDITKSLSQTELLQHLLSYPQSHGSVTPSGTPRGDP